MIVKYGGPADAQYITPTYFTFQTEWDKLGSAASATETFALSSLESLKGTSLGQVYLQPARWC